MVQNRQEEYVVLLAVDGLQAHAVEIRLVPEFCLKGVMPAELTLKIRRLGFRFHHGRELKEVADEDNLLPPERTVAFGDLPQPRINGGEKVTPNHGHLVDHDGLNLADEVNTFSAPELLH